MPRFEQYNQLYEWWPPSVDALITYQVHNKCIGDGDGFTAYVNTAEPRESGNVPLEVHEMVIKRTQARADRDYPTANALQRSLDEAGYKYSNWTIAFFSFIINL